VETLGKWERKIHYWIVGPDPPTTSGNGFDAAFAKLLWPLVYCQYALVLYVKLKNTTTRN